MARRFNLRSEPSARVLAVASPRRSATTTLIELRPQPLSSWDITAVRSALDQHEEGDLARSALLAEALLRDARIGAGLRTRVAALVGKGSGFTFEAAETRKATSGRIAKRLQSSWHEWVPDAVLARLLADCILLGVAYGTIAWSTSPAGEWIPRLTPWHPGNLTWEDSEQRWYTQTRTGRVAVDRADPAWFLVEPAGMRSFMGGAIRALGLPFVFRNFSERDWLRYNERHGMPVIKVREPAGIEGTERDAFYSRIKRMGREAVVGLPGGTPETAGDVSFLEFSAKGGQDAFGSFLERLDKQIDLTLLGQTLTTEVSGGSLAAARVHDRVRSDYLSADAEMLGSELRSQVIVPWCAFNVPGFKVEDAPWPAWETEQPEDLNESAERMGKALTALQTARDIGLPVDIEAFAEKFNIPLTDELQLPPKPAPVAAPPPEPPEDDGEDDAEDDDMEKPATGSAIASFHAAHPGCKPSARGSAGFVEGQLYADALADRAGARLAQQLSGDIDQILAIVQEAESYEDARRLVGDLYRDRMSPEAMSVLVEKVLILGQLAGVSAVMQDT